MLKKDKTKKTLKPSELSRACAEARADEVHKLLRAPGMAAKLNKPDEQGITPLLLTCTFASTSTSEADLFNYLSICKMLVDSGADPTLGTSSNTNYPLHILCKICISPSNASLKIFFESLLGYLISKGAEVNKLNAEGLTPLHEAARKGAADACACLLEKGASLTARSGRGGMTPLHLAVSANHEATVRVMLRKGADPDLKSDSGSARDIAATLKLTRIIQLIEQHEPSGKSALPGSAAGTSGVHSNTVVIGPATEVQATVGPSRATCQLSEGDIDALVSAITAEGDDSKPLQLPMPDLGRPPSMPAPDRPPSIPAPAPSLPDDDYPVSDTADVKFLVDPSGQTTVRAATLDRLIERMTGLKDPEGNFVTAFLTTYRSFTPPVPLFMKLLMRYRSSDLETIQIRVLDVIKAWIELHYYDFEDERELATMLNDFCDSEVPAEHRVLLNTLKTALRTQKEHAAELAWQDVMAGAPNATTSLSFHDLSTDDVAAQLTLIESRIYRRIRPKELLDQRWMKKGKDEHSPNIMNMIQHFNHVTRWVQTEILGVSNLKRRAEAIQKFITLAKSFRGLHNFNGVIEILAGLSTTAIRRLSNTWAQVDEASKAELHELETLMSYQGSYKNYRLALRDGQPPCLPYLGMYLSDISFISEGQPNQTDGGLINFLKCSKIARVIAEIQYFQETSHSAPNSGITEREEIVTWWRATQAQLINERDAHAKSLKLESLGDKEDPEIALVEAANLRKENEDLKLRVAQLEQLSHQQQDTIEKLTQKLGNMQREMRMTRDITQMLNASRTPAAKPTPPVSTTTLPTKQSSALSPRSTPVQQPKPPVVESEPESEPEPFPEMEQPAHTISLPPEPQAPNVLSPRTTATATTTQSPADDEVSATQKQLQENAAKLAELREKYKARQAGGTEPSSPAPTASVSSPALGRRTGEPSAPSAPATSNPKSSQIKRPLVEPPKPKPPEELPAAPASTSAAAALREKFKLGGKTSSAPGSAVGPRTETSFSSTPGEGDAGTAPPPEDPNALLDRMRALRENYKREGPGPAGSGPRPIPSAEPLPATPPAASSPSFSPPPGAVRVMIPSANPPAAGKGPRPLPKGPPGKK